MGAEISSDREYYPNQEKYNTHTETYNEGYGRDPKASCDETKNLYSDGFEKGQTKNGTYKQTQDDNYRIVKQYELSRREDHSHRSGRTHNHHSRHHDYGNDYHHRKTHHSYSERESQKETSRRNGRSRKTDHKSSSVTEKLETMSKDRKRSSSENIQESPKVQLKHRSKRSSDKKKTDSRTENDKDRKSELQKKVENNTNSSNKQHSKDMMSLRNSASKRGQCASAIDRQYGRGPWQRIHQYFDNYENRPNLWEDNLTGKQYATLPVPVIERQIVYGLPVTVPTAVDGLGYPLKERNIEVQPVPYQTYLMHKPAKEEGRTLRRPVSLPDHGLGFEVQAYLPSQEETVQLKSAITTCREDSVIPPYKKSPAYRRSNSKKNDLHGPIPKKRTAKSGKKKVKQKASDETLIPYMQTSHIRKPSKITATTAREDLEGLLASSFEVSRIQGESLPQTYVANQEIFVDDVVFRKHSEIPDLSWSESSEINSDDGKIHNVGPESSSNSQGYSSGFDLEMPDCFDFDDTEINAIKNQTITKAQNKEISSELKLKTKTKEKKTEKLELQVSNTSTTSEEKRCNSTSDKVNTSSTTTELNHATNQTKPYGESNTTKSEELAASMFFLKPLSVEEIFIDDSLTCQDEIDPVCTESNLSQNPVVTNSVSSMNSLQIDTSTPERNVESLNGYTRQDSDNHRKFTDAYVGEEEFVADTSEKYQSQNGSQSPSVKNEGKIFCLTGYSLLERTNHEIKTIMDSRKQSIEPIHLSTIERQIEPSIDSAIFLNNAIAGNVQCRTALNREFFSESQDKALDAIFINPSKIGKWVLDCYLNDQMVTTQNPMQYRYSASSHVEANIDMQQNQQYPCSEEQMLNLSKDEREMISSPRIVMHSDLHQPMAEKRAQITSNAEVDTFRNELLRMKNQRKRSQKPVEQVSKYKDQLKHWNDSSNSNVVLAECCSVNDSDSLVKKGYSADMASHNGRSLDPIAFPSQQLKNGNHHLAGNFDESFPKISAHVNTSPSVNKYDRSELQFVLPIKSMNPQIKSPVNSHYPEISNRESQSENLEQYHYQDMKLRSTVNLGNEVSQAPKMHTGIVHPKTTNPEDWRIVRAMESSSSDNSKINTKLEINPLAQNLDNQNPDRGKLKPDHLSSASLTTDEFLSLEYERDANPFIRMDEKEISSYMKDFLRRDTIEKVDTEKEVLLHFNDVDQRKSQETLEERTARILGIHRRTSDDEDGRDSEGSERKVEEIMMEKESILSSSNLEDQDDSKSCEHNQRYPELSNDSGSESDHSSFSKSFSINVSDSVLEADVNCVVKHEPSKQDSSIATAQSGYDISECMDDPELEKYDPALPRSTMMTSYGRNIYASTPGFQASINATEDEVGDFSTDGKCGTSSVDDNILHRLRVQESPVPISNNSAPLTQNELEIVKKLCNQNIHKDNGAASSDEASFASVNEYDIKILSLDKRKNNLKVNVVEEDQQHRLEIREHQETPSIEQTEVKVNANHYDERNKTAKQADKEAEIVSTTEAFEKEQNRAQNVMESLGLDSNSAWLLSV